MFCKYWVEFLYILCGVSIILCCVSIILCRASIIVCCVSIILCCIWKSVCCVSEIVCCICRYGHRTDQNSTDDPLAQDESRRYLTLFNK